MKRRSPLFVAPAMWLFTVLAGAQTLAASQPVLASNASMSKGQPAASLSSLPAEAQPRISGALGRVIADYQVDAQVAGFRIENARNKLATDFRAEGVEVRAGSALWRVALQGYGYGDTLRPVQGAAPKASSNRVEYRRGPLTEWYVNGPLGLEQGFTLDQPPSQSGGQQLTIALALSGNVTAAVDRDRKGLTLTSREGQAELRYTGLAAHDASGRELRALLELQGTQLLLKVDAAGARYPVVIDPLVQLAQLTASEGQAGDEFGTSVASSGNTIVVGAPNATIGTNSQQGAVYVFVEPATGWATMTQTAELTSSDGEAGDNFGFSVGISAGTVIVGAPGATIGSAEGQGAAYVFVQPSGGWTNMTQTAKLTASDGAELADFGESVSASDNGSDLIVGAPYSTFGTNASQGTAYVFVKPRSGWTNTTQTAELTASDGAAWNMFGSSVSFSNTTAVVGAPWAADSSNSFQGAAYVFAKPASGWANMTQTAKLTASDGAADDTFGWSVAMSTSTVAVGAPGHTVGLNEDQGAAYVFVMPAGGWANMTQTAELTASDGNALDQLGNSVAITGNTVVAGAHGAMIGSNQSQGAVYEFLMPKTGWTNVTQSAKLTATDGAVNSELGWSVAISSTTAVAGAIYTTVGENQYQGAAYAFGPPTKP